MCLVCLTWFALAACRAAAVQAQLEQLRAAEDAALRTIRRQEQKLLQLTQQLQEAARAETLACRPQNIA